MIATMTSPMMQPTAVVPTKIRYGVLDIETGNPKDLATVVAQQLADWTPPSNIKDDDKIALRRLEFEHKCQQRGALTDAAPILCICLASDLGRVAFDGMSSQTTTIDGWQVFPCGDERTMLEQFRTWANYYCSDASVLVGHNALSFDLPKLRVRYLAHRLRLPKVLQRHSPKDELENQPVYDTMRMFTRYFSQEHGGNPYCSLDALCASFGIERPKAVVSGAEVPRMYEAGQYGEILTYCAVDVLATEEAYLLMVGQDKGMS